MYEDHHHGSPPRWALASLFALGAMAIAIAYFAPALKIEKKTAEALHGQIEAAVDLRFEDRHAGRVAVLENETGQVIALLKPGAFGFLRTVMRGLARERRLRGLDRNAPFEVTRTTRNQLHVNDPLTGKSIYLNAFSLSNAKTFELLLDAALKVRNGRKLARSEKN